MAAKKVTVTFGRRRRSRRWGVRRGRRGKREEGKGGEKKVTKKVTKKGDSHIWPPPAEPAVGSAARKWGKERRGKR